MFFAVPQNSRGDVKHSLCYPTIIKRKFMVALYSFFSAREAWVRMARAREYLKKKQK